MTRSHQTTAFFFLAVAAGLLLTAGCGPREESGAVAGDSARAEGTDTAAPAERSARDTLVTDTGAAGDARDTLVFQREREAATETVPADTAPTRRWPPGGYMVYVREDVDPDSVAADHGVEPESVEPTLPGFYARLTAEQATALGRDERVEEMAKQIEERGLMEPREIPTVGGADTASG